MRSFVTPLIVLAFTISGCSSDITNSSAATKIKEKFQEGNGGPGIMVGEVKIADLPRCLAKMKQMNASEKQIWNISSSISSIQNFAVNASAHAEFKEVSGVEIISENERRAQFTYALIMDPPISKDFKPLTADDLKFPDACLENSPVLRLLVGSGGTKPIVIPAIATFKRFSDGWRVVDFSSEFTGPVEKRPPFLLILEEQLAIK